MKKIIFILIAIFVLIGVYLVVAPEKNTQEEQVDDVFVSNDESTIQGEASYTVQKVFLNKPGEEIKGSTQDISGDVSYEEGMLSGSLVISTENLSTGNTQRDDDVRELLGSNIRVSISNYPTAVPLNETVPVEITIKDVARTVPFALTVEEEENGLSIRGDATVLMSAFSIEPPSLLGVYSVEDEVQLKVTLTVKK